MVVSSKHCLATGERSRKPSQMKRLERELSSPETGIDPRPLVSIGLPVYNAERMPHRRSTRSLVRFSVRIIRTWN